MFILVGFAPSTMAGTQGGSTLRLPDKVEVKNMPNNILCEAILRRAKGTTDANKLVEFQTTPRGRTLQWYMKFVHCPQSGVPPTLDEVKQQFVIEFQQPKSEQ